MKAQILFFNVNHGIGCQDVIVPFTGTVQELYHALYLPPAKHYSTPGKALSLTKEERRELIAIARAAGWNHPAGIVG